MIGQLSTEIKTLRGQEKEVEEKVGSVMETQEIFDVLFYGQRTISEVSIAQVEVFTVY